MVIFIRSYPSFWSVSPTKTNFAVSPKIAYFKLNKRKKKKIQLLYDTLHFDVKQFIALDRK